MVTRPEDSYSIVVVGAMNPAIHHHSWYLLTEILTPEEAETASKGGALLCTAQVAQFAFGPLTITCEPNRWQIITEDQGALSRAVEIAEKTFRVLNHTPVSAFGFNFMHHRQTRLPKVSKTLGRLIRDLPIGLMSDPSEIDAAKLNYQHATGGGRVVAVKIEPSVLGDDWLFVAINVEYPTAAPDGKLGFFDLNLNERFPRDHEHAQQQLRGIVDAVNRLGEN